MTKLQENYIDLILNQKELPSDLPTCKNELRNVIFFNKFGNLHLTRLGFDVLKCFFRHYEVSLSEDFFLTSRNILHLTKKCTQPFHLDTKNRKLYLFERELATFLILSDGRFDVIENF